MPEDEAFLLEVYASTRAAELALVPWSDEQRAAFVRMQFQAQDSHYRQRYPDADFQVILFDNNPVGRIYVFRDEQKLRILDITVLPVHRNAGIGTAEIERVMAEGAGSGKAVQIYVENFNPSLHLFERLGFAKIAEAEDGFNLLLEWQPQANQPDSMAAQ